jgi:hypothetical protein
MHDFGLIREHGVDAVKVVDLVRAVEVGDVPAGDEPEAVEEVAVYELSDNEG